MIWLLGRNQREMFFQQNTLLKGIAIGGQNVSTKSKEFALQAMKPVLIPGIPYVPPSLSVVNP